MPKNPPKPPLKHLKTPNNHEHQTTIMMPMYPNPPPFTKKDKKHSKCMVYLLTLFVLLCLVALVFSSLVLRIKNPVMKITSITLQSMRYDYSPSFNMTLLVKLSISNRYFGHLDLGDQKGNSVTLGYANTSSVVGRAGLKFGSGHMGWREKEEVGIVMNVSSLFNGGYGANGGLKLDDKIRVLEDLNAGVLGFTGYAQVKGEIHVLKKVRVSTLADMKCTFQIDVVHTSVQKLQC